MTDAAPVSAIGFATIRALSEETGMELDTRRFRANFYVRWERDEPFFEDQLVGRAVRIGEKVTVQFVKKDERCVMITLDPDTATPSPIVLEKVTHQHERCIGRLRRGAARRHRSGRRSCILEREQRRRRSQRWGSHSRKRSIFSIPMI